MRRYGHSCILGHTEPPFWGKGITIHQRYRRTDTRRDRQTTCDRKTALCTKVHRAVKTAWSIAHCASSLTNARQHYNGEISIVFSGSERTCHEVLSATMTLCWCRRQAPGVRLQATWSIFAVNTSRSCGRAVAAAVQLGTAVMRRNTTTTDS